MTAAGGSTFHCERSVVIMLIRQNGWQLFVCDCALRRLAGCWRRELATAPLIRPTSVGLQGEERKEREQQREAGKMGRKGERDEERKRGDYDFHESH